MSFEKPKFVASMHDKNDREDNKKIDYNQYSNNPDDKKGLKYNLPNDFGNIAVEMNSDGKDMYTINQIVDMAVSDNIDYEDFSGNEVTYKEYIPNAIKGLVFHALDHVDNDSGLQAITDVSMLMQGLDLAEEKYQDNPEVLKKTLATKKFIIQAFTQRQKGRMEELQIIQDMQQDVFDGSLKSTDSSKSYAQEKLEKLLNMDEKKFIVADGTVNAIMFNNLLSQMYPSELSQKALDELLENNEDLIKELAKLDNKTIKLLILHNKKKDSITRGLTTTEDMERLNGVAEQGDQENLTEYYAQKNIGKVFQNINKNLLSLVEKYRQEPTQ